MLEKSVGIPPMSDLLEFRSLVNNQLILLLGGMRESSLKPLLEYSLLSPGKRLRPLLLLLSNSAVGGDVKKALPLAMSIEVLHTATLVHDDAIDQDRVRRGAPTISGKWGVAGAILAGDALISLSIDLASYYGSEVVRVIARTGFELSDEEHAETSSSLKDSTEEQYFKRIRGKSASLFKAASTCGALAGNGDAGEVEALGEFGERFGLAYQIRDDIEDLTELGGEVPRDLRNKVPTLPIIHLYRNGDAATRRLLEKIFTGTATVAESYQLITELEKNGSISYSEQKIKENLCAASKALSAIRSPEARASLLGLFNVIAPNREAHIR